MQGDFRLAEWLVQPSLGRVSKADGTVHLRAKVMDLLVFLAQRPGEVVSKDALLAGVWGTEFISESALTRVVTELRHALGDEVDHPRILETIPKRGYRLIAPVLAAGQTEPPAPPDATSESPPGQLFSPAAVDSASAARGAGVRPEQGIVKPVSLGAGSAPWPGTRESHRLLLLGALVREWTKKDESLAARKPRRWIWYGGLAALAFAVVLALTLNACGLRERVFRGRAQTSQSIPVLPLASLSGNPEQQVLVDGMHEALINTIGRIDARELNVDAVVGETVARECLAGLLPHPARVRRLSDCRGALHR